MRRKNDSQSAAAGPTLSLDDESLVANNVIDISKKAHEMPNRNQDLEEYYAQEITFLVNVFMETRRGGTLMIGSAKFNFVQDEHESLLITALDVEDSETITVPQKKWRQIHNSGRGQMQLSVSVMDFVELI